MPAPPPRRVDPVFAAAVGAPAPQAPALYLPTLCLPKGRYVESHKLAKSGNRAALRAAMATIEGSEPIEVCGIPTTELFVEGEVLDNPRQVEAELKDDLSKYNKMMLANMADFFQAQVESKSAGAKVVSPYGDSCTC